MTNTECVKSDAECLASRVSSVLVVISVCVSYVFAAIPTFLHLSLAIVLTFTFNILRPQLSSQISQSSKKYNIIKRSKETIDGGEDQIIFLNESSIIRTPNTMKLISCYYCFVTIAAALNMAVVLVRVVNCSGLTTLTGREGAISPVNGCRLVCPLDYVQLTTYDGDNTAINVNNYCQRQPLQQWQERNNRETICQQTAATQVSSIARERKSCIEFAPQNTIRFASAPPTVRFDVGNNQKFRPFTKFTTDVFRSKNYYFTVGCSNGIMEAHCAAGTSFVIISAAPHSENSEIALTTYEPLQRQNRAKGIGSESSTRNEIWNIMYQRLVAYKNEHNGNTKVPRNYDKDPQLGGWINHQRKAYNKGKMPMERISALDSISFDWGTPQRDWNEMYERLVAYKVKHDGDTKVPFNYDEDVQLGRWVATQRRMRIKKKMSAERASFLNLIDFDWGERAPPREGWDEMQTFHECMIKIASLVIGLIDNVKFTRKERCQWNVLIC